MAFEKLWQKIEFFSLIGLKKTRFLHELCTETLLKFPDADIAECGVYMGGTAVMLSTLLKEHGRKNKVWLFDSYAGLPEVDPERDCYYSKGGMSGKDAEVNLLWLVKELLKKHKCDRYAILKKGWFDKTLPRLPKNQKFSFIHVDCDIYVSTKTCLKELYPRLHEGGIMLFDDYLDIGGGQRLAVNEFVKSTGDQLFAGWYQQAYLIKGRRPLPSDKPYLVRPKVKGQVSLHIERLMKEKSWLKTLQNEPNQIGSFNPNPTTVRFILSLQKSAAELNTIFDAVFFKSRRNHLD